MSPLEPIQKKESSIAEDHFKEAEAAVKIENSVEKDSKRNAEENDASDEKKAKPLVNNETDTQLQSHECSPVSLEEIKEIEPNFASMPEMQDGPLLVQREGVAEKRLSP